MTTYRLFRSLKQADLEAMSAFEALKSLCPDLKIKSLKRYDSWNFSFGQGCSLEVKSFFDGLLKGSYFFVNPTKHNVFYQSLPKCSLAATSAIKVMACRNKAFETTTYPITLARKLKNISVQQIRYWEFLLEDSPHIDSVFESAIINPAGSSSSLMYNPIYQSAFIESRESLYD